MSLSKWECLRCGNISEGVSPPEFCVECKSFGEDWGIFAVVNEHAEPLDTPVEEFVRDNVPAIDGDETIFAAAKLMQEKRARCAIVLTNGKPAGLVTEKDIIHRAVAEGLSITSVTVRKIMSTPLIAIPADAALRTALRLMRRYKIRRLAVQKGAKIIGLVTSKCVVGDIHRLETETCELENTVQGNLKS